jgi:hypothetical protein
MHPEAFIFLGIFVGLPLVLASIYRTHLQHVRVMKTLQLKAEANARMLDRFGSDGAFLEFLKSDAQQKMFDVTLPEPRVPAPYMRMLTAFQVAFLLLSAGLACLYIRGFMFEGDKEAFLFLGTMGVALGIGSLLSAGAALVVARWWGQLQRADAGARS